MPRFDGTGPMGQGPRTGRGMGPCGGGLGYGRGRGFGRGLGCKRFWDYSGDYARPITKKEESEMLKDEVSALEDELKAVKERLAEIKDQK